jgi:prepilin-type processing-associated H-X9-DG protein
VIRATQILSAFTLLELLLTIAIIACLVGLLLPTLSTVRQRADSAACVANLRQIGISAQLYAGEHDQTMPVIEPWPSQPVYSSQDGAQSLLDALKAYGVTEAVLHCRSDISGPNYYAKEGSSYQWCPMASGQNVNSVKMVWAGNVEGVTLSRLLMAFDYTNVHHKTSNVLFGDCHVATGN